MQGGEDVHRRPKSMPLVVAFALIVIMSLGSSAAPVKVTMIAETRETHLQWQEEMKARFEAEHPNVTIELVSTAGTGLTQKMQAMLAAGLPLEIGYMDPWLIIQWAKEGVVENLTPYMQRSRSQFADWYPSAFDLYRLSDGVYGLPQDLQITGIFYNVDAFHESGLPLPRVDWNLADLKEAARRLTKRATDGTVSRYGFRIPNGRNFLPTIWAHGGELFDSWTEPTRFIGNNDKVAAGFEYLAELVSSGVVPDKTNHGRLDVTNGFMAGHFGMVQTNSISIAHYGAIKSFTWDVAPLPTGEAGRIPFINAIGWFIIKDSAHKDEAWEVLRYFTTPEALRRRVEIVGNVPPSARVVQSVWIPDRQAPASRQALFLDVEKAGSPWPIHNNIWAPVDRQGMAAIWGETPVRSALENMEAMTTAIIKDFAGR
jgi:multiple sugar transport system substrate-binding protein